MIPSTQATQPAPPSGGGPNANPLDLFPQVRTFLRHINHLEVKEILTEENLTRWLAFLFYFFGARVSQIWGVQMQVLAP